MLGNSITSSAKARTPRTCGKKIHADLQDIVDNMSPQYLYGGASWAVSSFDAGNSVGTNLAKEWNIPYSNLTKAGYSVLESLQLIIDNPNKTSPVIFIYHDPLSNLKEAVDMSFKEFLTREDWKTIRDRCDRFCLDKINSLDRPVLLIGALNKVANTEVYKNITVGHINWQLWLAEQAGMKVVDQTVYVTPADGGNFCLNYFWGAQAAHKFLHENPTVTPDKTLLDAIWDIFFFWKELEKANLFYEVHPNYNGNRLFAEFLKPTVLNFLDAHK